jgi:transposase
MSEFGEGFKKEIGTYLTNWELHTKQINKLNRDIKCLSESSELDKYYRSVPGIGLLTARVLTVELGDMSRFKNVKQLYSYIGLTPSEFSSGDQRYLGRISKEGKPIIRAMLIQSAWKAIKEDKRLSPIYKELKHRKGGKRAIVAIARRLAGIARSCAKNGSLYKMPEVKEDKKMAA